MCQISHACIHVRPGYGPTISLSHRPQAQKLKGQGMFMFQPGRSQQPHRSQEGLVLRLSDRPTTNASSNTQDVARRVLRKRSGPMDQTVIDEWQSSLSVCFLVPRRTLCSPRPASGGLDAWLKPVRWQPQIALRSAPRVGSCWSGHSVGADSVSRQCSGNTAPANFQVSNFSSCSGLGPRTAGVGRAVSVR
jgi:hypothetical protein